MRPYQWEGLLIASASMIHALSAICEFPLKVANTLSRISEIAAPRAVSRMYEPYGCHDVSHELKYVCLLLARHWRSRLCYLGANL